jgi:hypothetical protein
MALEGRLLSLAEQTDLPLVRLRKLVTFDRLLAHLVAVAPERWILKGAVALHFRVGPQFRSTQDLDLGRRDDEQAATRDFRLAQSVELGDYFSFAIQRTSKLDALVEGAAVRYHVTAELDGRPFERVTVDIGFGDFGPLDPEVLRGPDLLGFADIPAVEVPTLPLEQHVAEKVHAYTRAYAAGRTSTRVKDLVDLAAMASLFRFEVGRLRSALLAVFHTRSTHRLPRAVPPPPPAWSAAYGRMAAEAGLELELSAGYELARTCLDPVLVGAIPDDASWNPAQRTWQVRT